MEAAERERKLQREAWAKRERLTNSIDSNLRSWSPGQNFQDTLDLIQKSDQTRADWASEVVTQNYSPDLLLNFMQHNTPASEGFWMYFFRHKYKPGLEFIIKEKGLMNTPKSSIGAKIIFIGIGTPGIQKMCFQYVFLPLKLVIIKVIRAKAKVMAIFPVTLIPRGVKPKRLRNQMKKNRVNK